jgi:hypothetical protein
MIERLQSAVRANPNLHHSEIASGIAPSSVAFMKRVNGQKNELAIRARFAKKANSRANDLARA